MGKDNQLKDIRGVWSRIAPRAEGIFPKAVATENGAINRTDTNKNEHKTIVLPTSPNSGDTKVAHHCPHAPLVISVANP